MSVAASTFDSDEITGINVTPLVDIMLVLLIVFMIATRLDQPAAIDVQLPRAASATTEPLPTTLAIVVHRDGSLRLAGATVTLAAIEAAAHATPDAQAMVSADRGVAYEAIVGVMDALRRGGVYKLALPVESQ